MHEDWPEDRPDAWIEPEGEKFALGSLVEQTHWQDEYSRIVRDVLETTRSEAPAEITEGGGTVGYRLPRNDVLYKVRGQARYADNIVMEGMLHVAFARSPHPHARILSIDTAAAEAAPGVHAILTADEIPDERLLVGPWAEDTPVLARDKVRFVGEAVVAVAAESDALARRACDLVEIEYHHIKGALYHGFKPTPDSFLATPEKALLDLLYLRLRRGEKTRLDELDPTPLDQTILTRLARLYPRSVRSLLYPQVSININT